MSVQFDPSRNRWVVRWYESGRQRSRRFHDAAAARRFDAERARARAAARHSTTAPVARELMLLRARVNEVERQLPIDARMTGLNPCATREGVRWRIAITHKDGTTTTRRGYQTRDAAIRGRERLAQPIPATTTMSFAAFWHQWLATKRPDLSEGSIQDLRAHGSKRLLPRPADRPLATLCEHDIHAWMAVMIDQRDRRIV
jgi:hypothetical protein